MSDPHDPGAPRRPEDDVRRDEAGADDPFNRRRAMDDANVPPEYRETGRGEGVAGERGITPVAGRFSSDQAGPILKDMLGRESDDQIRTTIGELLAR